MRFLKPEPLTSAAFAPYGDVIECGEGCEKRTINFGNTTRFHNLAQLDLQAESGKPLVSIFRSAPLPRPIEIKVMERHPLSSQAFYPLEGQPFLVVVATKGEFDIKNLKAFITNGKQGVNYHAGVWHHYNLALGQVSDFMVIDRGGPEKNCDEVFLSPEESVSIDY